MIRPKAYIIAWIVYGVAAILLVLFLWYMTVDFSSRYDDRLEEEPTVEYHYINITVHEVSREAYAYLDDNETLIWENRYHLAFEYTIELTYDAPFKGDINCMFFWLKVNNNTVSHDSWGWSGILSPGERRTITGTYTPDVWLEDGTNLTLCFNFWHTYVNSRYGGHSCLGRVEVDVNEPWEVV